MKRESPVIHFLGHVYGSPLRGSWQRLNGNLYVALAIAVDCQMKFEPGDFRTLAVSFHSSYWLGTPPESIYSLACGGERRGCDNISAAISYETWMGRKPFLVEGRRIHVGSKLEIADAELAKEITEAGGWKWRSFVFVTSFNDAAGTVTAVTYKTTETYTGREQGEIDRRFTWTPADVKRLLRFEGFERRDKAEKLERERNGAPAGDLDCWIACKGLDETGQQTPALIHGTVPANTRRIKNGWHKGEYRAQAVKVLEVTGGDVFTVENCQPRTKKLIKGNTLKAEPTKWPESSWIQIWLTHTAATEEAKA